MDYRNGSRSGAGNGTNTIPGRSNRPGQNTRPSQGNTTTRPTGNSQNTRPGNGQPTRPTGNNQNTRPGNGQITRPGNGQITRPGQGSTSARPGQNNNSSRPTTPPRGPGHSNAPAPGNSYRENGYQSGMQNIQAPGNMPTIAPPANPPTRNNQMLRVDAASIRNCIYHFTYIWLKSGEEFWMFPTSISRSTITGFRWNRNYGWGFFGTELTQVASFMCR